MTSTSIAHVSSDKYILLSQETYAMHNNNYNYSKIKPKNNSII